jgi:hypothetical protein
MKKTDGRKLMDVWMPLLKKEPEFVGGFSPSYITGVCDLLKEKVANINDFWNSGKYFFITPIPSLGSEHSPFLAEIISNITRSSKLSNQSRIFKTINIIH